VPAPVLPSARAGSTACPRSSPGTRDLCGRGTEPEDMKEPLEKLFALHFRARVGGRGVPRPMDGYRPGGWTICLPDRGCLVRMRRRRIAFCFRGDAELLPGEPLRKIEKLAAILSRQRGRYSFLGTCSTIRRLGRRSLRSSSGNLAWKGLRPTIPFPVVRRGIERFSRRGARERREERRRSCRSVEGLPSC